MSAVSPGSRHGAERGVERALVALVWVAASPFALWRRLGESGRLGDGDAAGAAVWKPGRGSLLRAPSSEPRPAHASFAAFWLAARRTVRRVGGSPRSAP